MVKQLHKGTEDDRRARIIDISRARDAAYLPQLLARLDSDETYENRRHIVRALGNIGDQNAEAKLLGLLEAEEGVILGDVCEALGKLHSERARPLLETLSGVNLEFVAQKAQWALKQLDGG